MSAHAFIAREGDRRALAQIIGSRICSSSAE